MKRDEKFANAVILMMAVLLAFAFALQGCKKKTEPAVSKDIEDVTTKVQQTVADVIEQKTCPIMDGNPINKELYTEYKGKKVYFCCPGCEDKFKADPEKYITKLPQFKD
ncbi:MAG: YHS domain-containing protein [Planctomycetota bacterium]|jgi:YHS domain-containing protein